MESLGQFSSRQQAFSGGARAGGRQLRRAPRIVPRAVRRERRGQEHAGQAAGGHRAARRGRDRGRRAGRALRGSARRLARRHRHGPPGAGVLREPVGRREPLPGRPARRAGVHLAARDAASARSRCWPRSRRRIDVRRAGGRADGRRAADGADRRRGRQRRARDHLRRADQQPVPARDRTFLQAAGSPARTRGDVRVTSSHRMPEIFRLCDTITVLRDGRHVATKPVEALDEAALVQTDDRAPPGGVLARGTARRPRGERGAARRRELSSPRKLRGYRLFGSRGRGGGHRRAGRRRPHGHRARDLRPRPGGARAGRGRGHAARPRVRPRRRCAPASGSSPRIASGRAWC